MTIGEELARLVAMHRAGDLTDEEFAAAKESTIAQPLTQDLQAESSEEPTIMAPPVRTVAPKGKWSMRTWFVMGGFVVAFGVIVLASASQQRRNGGDVRTTPTAAGNVQSTEEVRSKYLLGITSGDIERPLIEKGYACTFEVDLGDCVLNESDIQDVGGTELDSQTRSNK